MREIADEAVFLHMVFFGQQPHVILKPQDSLQEPFGFGIPSHKLVIVGEPKAARQEGPFARGQSILDSFGFVSQDQTIAHQLFFDLEDGPGNPRIGVG